MSHVKTLSSRVVVKLGGSVITDKRGDRPRIRRRVLARLAGELGAASHGHVRGIVHGAGSFGHGPVLRSGIHRGARTAAHRLAWAEIQVLQNELNAAVCRALQRAGLPAIPIQASAMALLEDGKLIAYQDGAIRHLGEQSMIPVLYGVPAGDRARGCAILSGDVILPELAVSLGVDHLILGTDVNGVFTADPRQDRAARQIPRITPSTWSTVQHTIGGASSTDVTGGMRGKVETLLSWVDRGLTSRIIDLNRPGQLAEALGGKAVGTLICAD